jgi:hypothetical protein
MNESGDKADGDEIRHQNTGGFDGSSRLFR